MTARAVAGAHRWTVTPIPGPWHGGLHSRCTVIGGILDAGHELAGHASRTTTARYDRGGGRARARATADLRFPLPGGRDDGAERH